MELTPTETEILQMIADAYRLVDIARIRNIELCTLRMHQANIRKRLGADNTIQAVVMGMRRGLIK